MKSIHERSIRLIRIISIVALLLAGLGCSSGKQRPVEREEHARTDMKEIMRAHRTLTLDRVARNRSRMFQTVAARLRTGIDTALAWRQLDTLTANPTGDMFWMYPAAGFYFYCEDLLSDAWRARFRRAMKSYTPYRGDTENHFLMYYSTLLLFSQEWPELERGDWFNGKSSRENYEEARAYIDHWIDETAREGTTEWDSPRYLYFYLTPLLTLYDFTADSTLKRRVGMMIEYQLADYAAEYLNGSYCGAHSRDGDNSVIDPRNSEARSYGEFYFEDSLSFILPDLAYAAMSRFECPEIIREIAHDRDTSFVHREMKRSRAKIRFADQRYTPVYKYNYITPEYALGSIQGGLQQPIQQHSWGITFASRKTHNTIFGLHPYLSGMELGMFFPEEPELMVASVGATKGSYVSEDKWIGGSPYERILQDSNLLIALYQIDSSARFQHVDLFLPKTLDTIERDRSGWIFARMENAFAAIYPLNQEYRWSEESVNWRVRMPARPMQVDGYVVICGSAREGSYETFREQVRGGEVPETGADGRLSFSYYRPGGASVHLYAGVDYDPHISIRRESNDDELVPAISVRPVDALFFGPHLKGGQGYGDGVLVMECNGRRRVLDFNKNTIVER